LALYIMSGFAGHDALLQKLGTFKPGKSCLYIKRLDDVDLKVLTELIARSVEEGAQMGALPLDQPPQVAVDVADAGKLRKRI
jgi:hypothetical protein